LKNLSSYNQDVSVPRKKDVDAKQDKITVNGIVQGDGNGNFSAAQTVNGETIELNATAVGLGNVDNTSDANKPISTATQEALDGKQDKITASGILKGDGAGGVSAAVANTDYATCTNLRNGSAEGSIRTISATEESSTYTIGGYALAEGYDTRSSGNYSHAEGFKTNASGEYSHAEAYRTKASGAQSHAEGSWTQALDSSSHSEGNRTIASAEFSHAEGDSTKAQGKTSHSEGTGTIANHLSQHVQGEYNIPDASTTVATERGNYAHIVGNGTSSASSNAHTLDWSGNAWFAGDVYVGSTSGTNKDDGSKKLIKEGDAGLLPTVTTADNGKFLRVVNGAWAAATVDNANGGAF
jgi:hypothetical protein